jgi:butyryl-CoA dehydrogenase
MDFELTEEQKLIQEAVKDFVKKEIAPIAADIDESDEFPSELFKKMAGLGFLGISLPEEFGGSGGNTLSYILAVEEIAKVSLAVAITVAVQNSLVSQPISEFGNKEQKEKYLAPLAKGEKLGAFCLTEPNVGSDVGSLETTAELQNGYYAINGTKIFITNGNVADIYLVFAASDRQEKNIKKRLSAFIIEKGTPGFSFGTRYDKMGWRGSETWELIFEDVKVPPANLLGQRGDGFLEAMKTLDAGRISVAALGLGLAEGAFEAALKYAKARKQFGKNIIEFQAVQFMLADMATEIEASRHLIQRAVYLKEKGRHYRKESAMAKLYASETATKTVSKALQIHGGSGYMKDCEAERFYRDAKVLEIGEGTSEIQRSLIADEIKKGR